MYLKATQLQKLALGPVALLALMSTPVLAEQAQRWQTNMTPGITAVGQEIYDIHMLVFWICVGAGILVFAFMSDSYTHIRAHETKDKLI